MEEVAPSWEQRQAFLTEVSQWSLSGRIAIRAGKKGWSANLRWQQNSDRFEIQLNAPLGQGAAHFYGDDTQVVMELPDQPPKVAASVEELLQEALGWHVPIEGLRYWITGLPAPTTHPKIELDNLNRLDRLQQSGWQINYRRYTQVGQMSLPKKIELNNHDLRLRLMIDEWVLEPIKSNG